MESTNHRLLLIATLNKLLPPQIRSTRITNLIMIAAGSVYLVDSYLR